MRAPGPAQADQVLPGDGGVVVAFPRSRELLRAGAPGVGPLDTGSPRVGAFPWNLGEKRISAPATEGRRLCSQADDQENKGQ